MPREKSVISKILIFAIFVGLEVASLLILLNNGALQRTWIAGISHSFMAKTWGATQSARSYFSLKKQNDELALENHRLQEAIRRYENSFIASDSASVVVVEDGFSFTPAKIVKSSANSQHNYLILNKGSDDGIRQNSGIVTPKGVVGIIDAVSRHYSYALSFMNTEMSISARLGRDGVVGPLVWDGLRSDGAILKEIPLQIKFAPGDTVFTSGYSSIFPADIPLGVAGTGKVVNGATNEISVSLFQNHKTLKYVTIVDNARMEEIEEIEKLQEEKR